MTPDEARLARSTAWIVAALVLFRLIAGALTPLTFDEAYYWTWSRHLAGGYYDHPPMVAVVIRLGTMIAGDSVLGVRLVSILLGLPMSWAVWRAARILSGDVKVAATATILLNATLLIAVGTIIVTPDAPLIVASSFVLYFLAKVVETGRGIWWLAVGVAVGCALLSKYTALFFGAEILLWLLLVRDQRRWLASPWPYLGGIVAFAIFSPVVLWNADHQWVSFIKQLGRARVDGLTLKFFAELVPAQFALATPSVAILGGFGLYALARKGSLSDAARGLINVSFWTIAVYFTWHSLHERVEGNWLGPVYPAFVIAAACAVHKFSWSARSQRWIDLSNRWALPIGVTLFAVLIVQTNTGVFTGFRREATMRSVGVGWVQLAQEIEKLRIANNATCVQAGDYGTVAWLMFYMPKGTCVMQGSELFRWGFAPEPDANLLKGRSLLVGQGEVALRSRYASVTRLAELPRLRSGVAVETYDIDLLQNPIGDPLDRSLPPELGGPR